jgi:anti-sigma factor RsiW
LQLPQRPIPGESPVAGTALSVFVDFHLNADATKEIEQWLAQCNRLTARRFNQLDAVLSQLKGRKS